MNIHWCIVKKGIITSHYKWDPKAHTWKERKERKRSVVLKARNRWSWRTKGHRLRGARAPSGLPSTPTSSPDPRITLVSLNVTTIGI